MNSTTVATVFAAGLAMASLAAGGIALWLYRRNTLATPAPTQRPTNPPRKHAASGSDKAPPWFAESFDLFGSSDRAGSSDRPAAPEQPRAADPPASKARDPDRTAAHQAELDAQLEQQRRATEPAAAPTARAVEPTNRKRRYRVRAGQPIEIEIGSVPLGAVWRSSRADVRVRVIEQRGDRLRFVLDGPGGDVNLGLVQDGVKRPKAVRSWKFELCEAA